MVTVAKECQTVPLPMEEGEWCYLNPTSWWDSELQQAYNYLKIARRTMRHGSINDYNRLLETEKKFDKLRHIKKKQGWREK